MSSASGSEEHYEQVCFPINVYRALSDVWLWLTDDAQLLAREAPCWWWLELGRSVDETVTTKTKFTRISRICRDYSFQQQVFLQ